MRIASIELAGTSKNILRDGTPGLPRAFARICRAMGSVHFKVEIISSDHKLDRTHVRADDQAAIRSMAERLQRTLDGCEGTNSEIEEYVRVLQNFAD